MIHPLTYTSPATSQYMELRASEVYGYNELCISVCQYFQVPAINPSPTPQLYRSGQYNDKSVGFVGGV